MGDLMNCAIDELEEFIRSAVVSNPWSEVDSFPEDMNVVGTFSNDYGYFCR